jgi:hypothetical protein
MANTYIPPVLLVMDGWVYEKSINKIRFNYLWALFKKTINCLKGADGSVVS